MEANLTRPLPAGFELSTSPDGTVFVARLDEPGTYYSLAAWRCIEQGHKFWRGQHDAIFRA